MTIANTALSLLPVLTVLTVSIFTKRALLGLFCGTVVGAVLLGGWSFFDTSVELFGATLANETMIWLTLLVVLFGILIVYFTASGAVSEFAEWTERFVNSRRKSLVMTWILTVVLFVDDYLNALTVGTSMKKVTDHHRVPRTMLGAIVKMTSAPIAIVVPFSSWAIFFAALLEDNGVTAGGSGFGAYLQGIPFLFFGWFALAIGLLLASGMLPLVGPMRRAQLRAYEIGDTLPADTSDEERALETAAPPQTSERPLPFNFLIPLMTLIAVTLLTDVDILKGSAAAVVVAIILYLSQRRVSVREILSGAFEGVMSMGYILVLFVLAFMIQQINMELELAEWMIRITEPALQGALLPAIVFLVCGVYAYATGAVWDLAAVITPVVVPLSIALDVDPILAASAVFSGAALGSSTCLYGDGMILASKSVGVKSINLMLSILPYAAAAAVLTVIAYVVAGFATTG